MSVQENNLQEGSVLMIDKELRWTSFDVIKKIRNLLKVKKVGHAGTLDPLATGLLIICTGKKTKSIDQFQGLSKEYTGTIEIGRTTPSFDLETDFDSKTGFGHIKDSDIHNLTEKFKGEMLQTPPVYSAIKINGKRAYNFARNGEEVEIKSKLVQIEKFNVTEVNLPEFEFSLTCSKGFYVRSLARDIGIELGVGAYLKGLRREKIGKFDVADAMTISQLEKSLKSL